jgi:PII-like signaling protein
MAPSKLIEIHCSELDRWEGKPLHEAIVERCRSLGIAGATVLRGIEGYGETAALHHQHLLRHDLPVTVLVVDEEDRIRELARAVEPMMDKGLLTISDIRARRVHKRSEKVP